MITMVQGDFHEAIVCPNCKNDDQELIGATINIGMFGLSPNHVYYKCFKCGHKWEEKDPGVEHVVDADAY